MASVYVDFRSRQKLDQWLVI